MIWQYGLSMLIIMLFTSNRPQECHTFIIKSFKHMTFYLGLFDGILTSTQNSNHHQIMRFWITYHQIRGHHQKKTGIQTFQKVNFPHFMDISVGKKSRETSKKAPQRGALRATWRRKWNAWGRSQASRWRRRRRWGWPAMASHRWWIYPETMGFPRELASGND